MTETQTAYVAPSWSPPAELQRALVVGGTGAIGSALANRLEGLGWNVVVRGRELDLRNEQIIKEWCGAQRGSFSLVVLLAGELRPDLWQFKNMDEYVSAYKLHAAGPIVLLANMQKLGLLPWWAKVVFVSTVGAVNSGAVDLGYGMAKAALEKAQRALVEHASWRGYLVRLDLVDTKMLRQLPVDTLHGRPILSPAEAADLILREAQIT